MQVCVCEAYSNRLFSRGRAAIDERFACSSSTRSRWRRRAAIFLEEEEYIVVLVVAVEHGVGCSLNERRKEKH